MNRVTSALGKSIKDLSQPVILWTLFIPTVISFTFWLVIYLLFAAGWVSVMSAFMQDLAPVLWLQNLLEMNFAGATHVLAIVILILLFLPLAYFSTVVLVSLFAMPVIIKFLRRRYYSELISHGTAFWASLWNTLVHSFMFLLLFAVTLPLWLVPGLQILIPILLTASLNRRIFSFDALSDVATSQEIKSFIKENKGSLFGLGLILGIFSYIPFIGFLVPVFGGLAYGHFCLQSLLDKQQGKSS